MGAVRMRARLDESIQHSAFGNQHSVGLGCVVYGPWVPEGLVKVCRARRTNQLVEKVVSWDAVNLSD